MELDNNKSPEDTPPELPKINIIIPVYNGEHTILKTLESVFSQNYENFDVTVIDDSSKDRSVQTVQESPFIDKITFIQNTTNIGISKAYNLGISKTNGDFFCFLHHDCYLIDPDYLSKGVSVLEDPQIGAVTGKPSIPSISKLSLAEKLYTVLNFMDILPVKEPKVEPVTFAEFKADLIRRETLQSIGNFPELQEVSHSGEDQDISSKLRDKNLTVVQHNDMSFGLNYGGNQDSFLKLFYKQAVLAKSQAFIILTHKQNTVQNLTPNRKLRAFHRSYQIGFSALILVLLIIFLGIYVKNLLLTILVALLGFRFCFYVFYTIQYGLSGYALFFPLVGFFCDLTYGISFFYGLLNGIIKGKLK